MEYSKVESRRKQLIDLIKQHGRVSLQEITDRLQISEATARRDLDTLEKSGQIIRSIGGAIYDGGEKEIPFSEKRSVLSKEKEQIAQTAASLVQEGDVIGLTGGTTTYLIAKSLKQKKNITVVTNTVNIATELAEAEDIQVVVTGGVMRNKSFELCGPLAEIILENINITKMFFGIDGFSVEQGFTMYSELENRITQLMISRSRKSFAVFDHSKLGIASLFTITPLHQVHGVILDRLPANAYTDAFQQANVKIYTPESLQ
ncbi:DeoR/GlpR family DNA-binding transcription regulator [Paenibacillus humicola]|uniref:DeoR/GlpR family DNA-binding transcription regulator n=1 Tax=Paenibacillus humicola TaxID=3110540 RepID=UPI00237A45F6|nr:DeoR/GlpR family DNA-binding transcription regulator [Paenibacillus humicola]